MLAQYPEWHQSTIEDESPPTRARLALPEPRRGSSRVQGMLLQEIACRLVQTQNIKPMAAPMDADSRANFA